MEICLVVLKKMSFFEKLLIVPAILFLAFINIAIGGVIRLLYYHFIVGVEVPEMGENYFLNFLKLTAWGIFGSLALSWFFDLWANLSPR